MQNDFKPCCKCGAELQMDFFDGGIPFTKVKCPACGFELNFMGDVENSAREYNALYNESKGK